MKILLSILILIITLSAMGQGKRITVPAPGGEWYFTASKPFPAKPGDTVLLDAQYSSISLNDVHGLPGKPIVFIGSKTKVGYKIANGRGASIITQRCSYLVFDGIEAGNELTNVYNSQGWNIQASHNIEIRNFKLFKSEVGFFTNQLSGHYPNIYIHDGEIFDINNAAKTAYGEGFYIGQTSGKDLTTTSLPNLRIENITMRNIGGDAIQLANCINASVKNVTVDGYGLNKINNQFFGVLSGGGTSATWENIHLKNGTGTPFMILGTGNVTVKNCTAINCGTADAVQDAFYIRQSFPTLKVKLNGNKVNRKSRNWITEVTPGLVIENSGNQFGSVIVAPPIPARVDSVAKSSYDSAMRRIAELSTALSAANNAYGILEKQLNNLEKEYKDLDARLTEIKNIVNKQ